MEFGQPTHTRCRKALVEPFFMPRESILPNDSISQPFLVEQSLISRGVTFTMIGLYFKMKEMAGFLFFVRDIGFLFGISVLVRAT